MPPAKKPVPKKAAKKRTTTSKPSKATAPGSTVSRKRSKTVVPTGSDPDAYYAALPPDLRELADRLRRMVKEAAPRASEAIKWGMPVFEYKGMLCYIAGNAGNDGYVRLGFYKQGVYLSDPDGLLEGTGEAMRHVKIRSLKDIRSGLISAWVKRAVEINEDA
jgi:hypothetical protein